MTRLPSVTTFEHVGIEQGDVGFLRTGAALLDLQADFGEYFGRGVFADVIQVSHVVSGLQTNEVGLGIAQESRVVKPVGAAAGHGRGCRAAHGQIGVAHRHGYLDALAMSGVGGSLWFG